jgi:hypothetical protein
MFARFSEEKAKQHGIPEAIRPKTAHPIKPLAPSVKGHPIVTRTKELAIKVK